MIINLEQIAKATDFSVPTVSCVLSNLGYLLSASTRQHINELVREMGYLPSLTTRSLHTDQSNTIGIIVDDILSPFAPRIVIRSKSMGSCSFEAPTLPTRSSESRMTIRLHDERGDV